MLDQLALQGAQGWVSKALIWPSGPQFRDLGDLLVSLGYGAARSRPLATVENSTASSRQQAPAQRLFSVRPASQPRAGARPDAPQCGARGRGDELQARRLRRRGRQGDRRRPAVPRPERQLRPRRLQLILENSGLDRDDHVRETRDELLRNQIAASIATIDVPQPLIEALYRYRNEERTVSFLVVDQRPSPRWARHQTAPARRISRKQATFEAPEYRKLGLLAADPAEIAEREANPKARSRRIQGPHGELHAARAPP